jgi:hypothetical protein
MNITFWTPCGIVTLCEEGRPKFPKVDAVPGLYMLVLNNGWCYIGQSKDIEHRVGEYRQNPTAKNIQEHRIHHAIRNAGGGNLYIFTGEHLKDPATRNMIETNEVSTARKEGKKLLNMEGNAGKQNLYCLQLDIKYHEHEIEKLTNQSKALLSSKMRLAPQADWESAHRL